jgi:hypothetical protein
MATAYIIPIVGGPADGALFDNPSGTDSDNVKGAPNRVYTRYVGGDLRVFQHPRHGDDEYQMDFDMIEDPEDENIAIVRYVYRGKYDPERETT